MERTLSKHLPLKTAFLQTRLALFEFAISHSLEELLQKAVDEVCAYTRSPIGFYHFVKSDQKTLSLQAWSTRTVEEFCRAEGTGMHYGIDQAGVWVECVRQRRPVIHNDYASLPHRKGMPPGHAAVVRELVVPIMRAECAESKAPDAKRDDVGTQSTIANQPQLNILEIQRGRQSAIRKILVMDDEEMLRNLAQKMLERLVGYKVETVKDGAEAIEAYKKHMDSGEPFDGVILDLTIKGGMGGAQAIKELVKIDPDVKAIVCSGYFNDPVLANYEEHGFRGAMAKPYQIADLERILEKVLG